MKKKLLSGFLAIIMICSIFTCLLPISGSKASAATRNQLNMVARADYMYGLTWVCQQYTEGWRGNFYAGETYHVPYGQPIYSGQYIGYHGNTFDSDGDTIAKFLEAANTPGSLFYTGRSYYTGTTAPYYVSDCSAFVSWCWGVNRTTTYYIPGITTCIGDMSVHHATWSLQLGDALNHPEHVIMVTGLEYDASGAITQIEITEQTPPQLKRSYYTPQQLYNKYYAYTIYRYYGEVPMAPGSAKWVQDDIGWKYEYADGSCASGWTKIDGEDYYFGGGNYMYTGWLQYDGKWYILNPANGIMQRGWFMVDGIWYYFDSNGAMVTGWVYTEENNTWYYTKEDGSLVTGWYEVDGITYHFDDESGAMATGWVSVDGEWQLFHEKGGYEYRKAENLGKTFTSTITPNSTPDKALSLNGNNVELRGKDGADDQVWTFERQSDGSYHIKNKSTGWLMDVQDAGVDNGTNVQTWEDNGGNAQKWVITKEEGCTGYVLRPVNAINHGKVMDVIDGLTADGTNIVLSTGHYGANQQFTFNAPVELKSGDADRDGEISIADVTYVQERVAGIITDTSENVYADVNGNGKIDIRDGTLIQMYLAKIIDKFPIG